MQASLLAGSGHAGANNRASLKDFAQGVQAFFNDESQ